MCCRPLRHRIDWQREREEVGHHGMRECFDVLCERIRMKRNRQHPYWCISSHGIGTGERTVQKKGKEIFYIFFNLWYEIPLTRG